MKRRYVVVVMAVIALALVTSVSVLAAPADPTQPPREPVIRIGETWGAIVQDRAAVHNFVRPAPEEPPVFTVMPGTTVRLVAAARGVWLGGPGGTLSADLEVYAVDQQDSRTLLGEAHVSDTKVGPAFEHRPLVVPVSFEQAGEVHLIVTLTATAEPQGGEAAQAVDELQAVVVVLDPTTLGSISGRVTADDTGEGLEGLPVIAGNPELRIRRTARTAADGTYTIESLPPGEYIVGVQAKGTAYVGELYDDAHSRDEATPVTVTEGNETTDISFSLERGAEISGQVTDAATEAPLAGIPIVVRPTRPPDDAHVAGAVPAGPAVAPQGSATAGPQARPEPRGAPGPSDRQPGEGRPRPRPAAVTGEDGAYVVEGLPAGEYVIAAVGTPRGYSVEFWQEAPTREEATPIAVDLGHSEPGINFTLEPQSR